MDVREKLVEQAISHFWYGVSHDIFSEPVKTYAKLAIEALEKENGVTVQEWISVDDRLPDACGFPCLLCGKNSFGQIRVFEGFTGYMERGKFEWHSNQKDIDIDVWTITHWMPLPRPPKGE